MFAAFLATVLFSLSAITGRRLSGLISGTRANIARLCFATIILAALSYLFGTGIHGAVFPILFLSGCVGFGVGDLSMFQAYPRIGARRTILLIQCLAAPFGGLIEWLWLHQSPPLAQAICGSIILAGVGIALMPRTEASPVHGLRTGTLFGVLSAFCQGAGAVISRKAYNVAFQAGHPFRTLSDGISAAGQRTVGGIAVSLLFLCWLKMAHKPSAPEKTDWKKGWPWIIANAFAGPILGVSCYQWALTGQNTSVVLCVVATTPLVVIPLAHYLEGDRITWRTVLGGMLAVAGVIGLTRLK